MIVELLHDGTKWHLRLETDEGYLDIPVTDVQAAMLQDIGIEVFAA